MTSDPSNEDIRSAWEIHRDADQIYHSRIHAYLVTQAFLFAAFVVALTGVSTDWRLGMLASAMCVFGIVASMVFRRATSHTLARLRFLKRECLIRWNPYQNYITASREREGLSYPDRVAAYDGYASKGQRLARNMLLLVDSYWIIALLIAVSFFLIGVKAK